MATIKLVVRTHQGKLFDEICDHIVVKERDGEFAIFPNHVSVITSFEEGFIKFVSNEHTLYLAVCSAVVEFSNNVATVLAQEAHVGETMESAKLFLEEVRKERLEKNRETEAELAAGEKDLLDNIKKAKAGNL